MVYIYMYVYIYICVHVYMHIYTHTYIYICMYVYINIFIRVHKYVYMYVYVCIYLCIYICKYIHTPRYMNMYIQIYTLACIYTRIYCKHNMYTYMGAHTHARTPWSTNLDLSLLASFRKQLRLRNLASAIFCSSNKLKKYFKYLKLCAEIRRKFRQDLGKSCQDWTPFFINIVSSIKTNLSSIKNHVSNPPIGQLNLFLMSASYIHTKPAHFLGSLVSKDY